MCGRACERVGVRVCVCAGLRREDEAARITAGLLRALDALHDIGVLTMLEADEPGYDGMVLEHFSTGAPLDERERGAFGFDHAQLGAHVLGVWRIPEPIPRIVACHHDLGQAFALEGQVPAMAAVLALADRLSTPLLEEPEPVPGRLAELASDGAAVYLGITASSLRGRWSFLRRTAEEARRQVSGAPPEPEATAADEEVLEESFVRPCHVVEAPEFVAESTLQCVVCDAAGFGEACPRCGGALCTKHTLGSAEVCRRCEADYAPPARAKGAKAWVGAGLLVVAASLAWWALGAPALDAVAARARAETLVLALSLAVALASAPAASWAVARFRSRARFLRAWPVGVVRGREVARSAG